MVRLVLRPFSVAAATVLAALLSGDVHAHPDLWNWMDDLQPEPVRISWSESGDGASAALTVELADRVVVVDLASVSMGRPVDADGPHGPATAGSARQALLYRGLARGGNGGSAAVSVAAGRLSASIRSEGEVLLVESPRPLTGTAAGVVLRSADDPFAGPSQLRPAASAGHEAALEQTVRVIEIAAVADFEFFQKFGGSSTDQMLGVLNLVDAIYLDQLALTLDVTFTKVFESVSDPFSNFNSANLFFNYRDATTEFGNYRDATGGALEAAGLAHLFSDRNLNVPMGGKINAGFAFIDVLCDADRGVGLSTAPTVGTGLHAVIVAHEFGHNFGAPHDSEGACAATPANLFLMSPSATGNTFSDCSKSIMSASRDEAACIDVVATTTTTTTTTMPSPCGDATGDQKLLASDALRVLRVGVGEIPCLLCICDVDNSGTVTASDALRVLRASVMQPVVLSCPAC